MTPKLAIFVKSETKLERLLLGTRRLAILDQLIDFLGGEFWQLFLYVFPCL